MGGSSSTRRVEVEQGDLPGTVKVSEAVAKRLISQAEGSSPSGASQRQSGQRPITYTGSQFTEKPSGTLRDAEEFQRMQSHYQHRIKQLELRNAELYQTTTDQFANAVEEIEEKFLKTTASPICQDLQEAVMRCYRDNPDQTLRCAEEVKAFAKCVRQSREKIFTKNG